MPASTDPTISFVLPVLNEQDRIATTLQQLRSQYRAAQLIVVDGGSCDDTVRAAMRLCDQLLLSRPGRAQQMNLGADIATGDYLFFLHADSLPTITAVELQHRLEQRPTWGFCQVRLSGGHPMFRLIAASMNLRSRLTRIATGDQMLFVRRETFAQSGGFDLIPLMEDVAISKRLRRVARPMVLKPPVETSSRRWRERGIYSTIVDMWCLRLAYALGVSPQRLWRHYYADHSGGHFASYCSSKGPTHDG